jgi:nitrate/nitrite transport system ATP-binding protein
MAASRARVRLATVGALSTAAGTQLSRSKGPPASIAEVVENVLSRGRTRQTIHRDARYYTLRNHLLDFLVTRSKRYRNGAGNEAARTSPIELPLEESAP